MSAWRKWRFGGNAICSPMTVTEARKDASEPTKVGIATARSTVEGAMSNPILRRSAGCPCCRALEQVGRFSGHGLTRC